MEGAGENSTSAVRAGDSDCSESESRSGEGTVAI